MRKIKMQKGITLIALIITIIVLLILAIVAISAVNDSGVIKYSQDAQEEYKEENEKEKVILTVEETYLSGLGKITEENLKKALDSNFGEGKYLLDNSNSEYFKVTITVSEREYKVYKNGDIESLLEDPLTKTEIPVREKFVESATINGEKYSSINPIIPAGFTPINISTPGQEARWDADGGPEVDKGLVIRDDEGNEFVWVPVKTEIDKNGYSNKKIEGYTYREPDVVTGVEPTNTVDSASGTSYDAVLENLKRVECTSDLNNDGKINAYDFRIQLTKEYKSMAESINKYNGFYVGRFETSRNGEKPQSKRSNGVAGSSKYVETAYNSCVDNDWYGLYTLNKKYSTNSVQGSMMWGIQFDEMLDWLGTAAYTTIGGYNKKTTCGTAPEDVINNVYDLYGNSHEMLLEAHFRIYRTSIGGSRSFSTKPYIRRYNFPTGQQGYYGSRMVLCVL